ncbi:MAG TPA: hemolysin III family protein [Anaeromyxobacter sp.]
MLERPSIDESGTPTAFAGGVPASHAAAPKARRKPRLRGVSHQIAAFASLPAAGALVLRAKSATGTTGAAIYGATLVLLFTISAVYHRMYWPLSIRRIIGRIDHAAIFLLIAGTYTPFGLLLGPGLGHRLLALVWIGALAGIVIVVWLTGTPKPVRASLYVLLGWFIVPVIPAIRAGIGDQALMLLMVGGAFYTVGAAIYAVRRPDPLPDVFGFHEVFHLLVVAAAVCHFLVVDAAIQAMR